jgi:hypothetical protein
MARDNRQRDSFHTVAYVEDSCDVPKKGGEE